MRAAQIRLLYANAYTGVAGTILVPPVLCYLQSGVVRRSVLLVWLLYMVLVSLARFTLARRYQHTHPSCSEARRWGVAFAIGAGLAGAGWGATGLLLYPEGQLLHQVLLFFVLGGMMLGGASILAPRPEAFLAFLVPVSIVPMFRLLSAGDEEHLAIGLLGVLFAIAIVTTTWRFYHIIESSLNLKFENEDLVRELQTAMNQTEALNRELEQRVQERTAEVHQATVHLRAEIDQRKQVEEELLRARNLESLGVLAGGIAHDFNNLLTIIQGNIEFAKMNLGAGDPVCDILQKSEAGCRRAAALASQLLAFGKGGAPVRHIVSMAKLVRSAVDLARAGSQVGISLETAEDLWCANIDATQVNQVLQNVLLNARQAMQDSGIIEVRAENVIAGGDSPVLSAGRYVKISVQDFGCGISADVLPRIFDPYFTTKDKGTGLGLATVHAIVARHQGHVAVESTPGVGSTFIIHLPASDQAEPAEVRAADVLHPGTGRILVMDDERALRDVMAGMLRRIGYAVECAADGAEAVARYERAKAAGQVFDAVLLDVTVPGGMGGIEAAARLREIDPTARLIVSSGYSDAPIMSEFQKYGFNDVMPKPWDLTRVSETLKRLLSRSPEQARH